MFEVLTYEISVYPIVLFILGVEFIFLSIFSFTYFFYKIDNSLLNEDIKKLLIISIFTFLGCTIGLFVYNFVRPILHPMLFGVM